MTKSTFGRSTCRYWRDTSRGEMISGRFAHRTLTPPFLTVPTAHTGHRSHTAGIHNGLAVACAGVTEAPDTGYATGAFPDRQSVMRA